MMSIMGVGSGNRIDMGLVAVRVTTSTRTAATTSILILTRAIITRAGTHPKHPTTTHYNPE